MPPRRAGHPSPLLCPVRKRDSSKAAVKYQTDVMALVERVKAAVHCSHLWVLLAGTPPPGGGDGRGPAPADLGQGLQNLLHEGTHQAAAPCAQSRGLSPDPVGQTLPAFQGPHRARGKEMASLQHLPFPEPAPHNEQLPRSLPPFYFNPL